MNTLPLKYFSGADSCHCQLLGVNIKRHCRVSEILLQPVNTAGLTRQGLHKLLKKHAIRAADFRCGDLHSGLGMEYIFLADLLYAFIG